MVCAYRRPLFFYILYDGLNETICAFRDSIQYGIWKRRKNESVTLYKVPSLRL